MAFCERTWQIPRMKPEPCPHGPRNTGPRRRPEANTLEHCSGVPSRVLCTQEPDAGGSVQTGISLSGEVRGGIGAGRAPIESAGRQPGDSSVDVQRSLGYNAEVATEERGIQPTAARQQQNPGARALTGAAGTRARQWKRLQQSDQAVPGAAAGPRPSATARAVYRPAVPDGTRGSERGLRGVAGLPARTKAVKKQKGAHGAFTGTHHVQWRYTPTRQAPPTGTRGLGVVDDGGRA